eukprot:RCo011921
MMEVRLVHDPYSVEGYGYVLCARNPQRNLDSSWPSSAPLDPAPLPAPSTRRPPTPQPQPLVQSTTVSPSSSVGSLASVLPHPHHYPQGFVPRTTEVESTLNTSYRGHSPRPYGVMGQPTASAAVGHGSSYHPWTHPHTQPYELPLPHPQHPHKALVQQPQPLPQPRLNPPPSFSGRAIGAFDQGAEEERPPVLHRTEGNMGQRQGGPYPLPFATQPPYPLRIERPPQRGGDDWVAPRPPRAAVDPAALGAPCAHVEEWRRLRTKKGMEHLLCPVCGVKWKTSNTYLVNMLQLPYCTTSTPTH